MAMQMQSRVEEEGEEEKIMRSSIVEEEKRPRSGEGLLRKQMKKMKQQWWSARRIKKLASAWRKWFQSLDSQFIKLLNKYLLYPLLSAAEAVVLVAKLCVFYVSYGCRL